MRAKTKSFLKHLYYFNQWFLFDEIRSNVIWVRLNSKHTQIGQMSFRYDFKQMIFKRISLSRSPKMLSSRTSLTWLSAPCWKLMMTAVFIVWTPDFSSLLPPPCSNLLRISVTWTNWQLTRRASRHPSGLGRHLAPVTICGVRYPHLSGEIANNIPDHQIM